MMKYAIFMGCKIPYYLKHYGTSTKAVFNELGVELTELEFNCCGYPNRDVHFESYILSSAKNIALSEKAGLNIITPCKCCFGSMKHANHWMMENEALRKKINIELAKDGLEWTGKTEIKHILSVLSQDIGLSAIENKIIFPQKNLKVAAHYGCHALRPSDITQFDNPLAPDIFEKLISITGAESINWSRRLDCCGNPIYGKNKEISLKLMQNKIVNARESNADCLCTACTYCQLQFDNIQYSDINKNDLSRMPSVLYTQLLGLSMGISEELLGLKNNKISARLS